MTQEFSYHDVINNNYPDGIHPRVGDFVTDVPKGIEYYVSALDNIGVPVLKELGNPLNNQTLEYRSDNHLPSIVRKPDAFINYSNEYKIEVGGETLFLGYDIFFDDDIVTGDNTDHYRLFKYDLAEVPVSASPDVVGSNLKDYVSAIPVSRPNGNYKAPSAMLVNRLIPVSDKVTLVAYDNENNPISIIPITVGASYSRAIGTSNIVGVEIVSRYNSSSDLSLIDMRDRVGTPSLADFTVKVTYDDESFTIHLLDDDNVRILGLEDFLVSANVYRSRIKVSYRVDMEGGESRLLSRQYAIVKNEPIPAEPVEPEVPVVIEDVVTGWIEVGRRSLVVDGDVVDFDTVQYLEPYTAERLDEEGFSTTSTNLILIPYGGWERGLRPSLIKVVLKEDGGTTDRDHLFKFATKGGYNLDSWFATFNHISNPEIPEDEYHAYIFIMRYPKSKYGPSDPCSDIGAMTLTGSYNYLRDSIREITVLDTYDDPVFDDYASLGRFVGSGSPTDPDLDLWYRTDPSISPTTDINEWNDLFKLMHPEMYRFLGEDRLYTSPRTPEDSVVTMPDDKYFWPNFGAEVGLNGRTYIGNLVMGNEGDLDPLVDKYRASDYKYWIPGEAYTEYPDSNLANKSFVVSVRLGRMLNPVGPGEDEDIAGPDWYIGINDWFKFTIDIDGNLIFTDTRAGESETFPVDISPNQSPVYQNALFLHHDNDMQLLGSMKIQDVLFAYDNVTGEASLWANGTLVKFWNSYPADFFTGENRMVYNYGTHWDVSTYGIMHIMQSQYLAEKVNATGSESFTVYKDCTQVAKTYGHTYYISSGISGAYRRRYPVTTELYESDRMPMSYTAVEIDFWVVEYLAEKHNIPFTPPDSIVHYTDNETVFPRYELNRHASMIELYRFYNNWKFKRMISFQTPGDPLGGVDRNHPGFVVLGSGKVFHWMDASLYSQEQVTAAINHVSQRAATGTFIVDDGSDPTIYPDIIQTIYEESL